jgi:hypothetical protein
VVRAVCGKLDAPPNARYPCVVDRIKEPSNTVVFTVLTFVSNVVTVNVGIVGSIGIIIAPRRP